MARALLRLAASMYVAVLGCLLAWVGAGVIAGGEPVVVTESSALDHLQQGDVVVVAPSSIRPGEPVVAAIEHGDRRMVRRVHSLGPGRLVATVDGRRLDGGVVVTDEELVGVAQFVVPAVGWPVALVGAGRIVPLVLWLAATAAAVASVVRDSMIALASLRRDRRYWPRLLRAEVVSAASWYRVVSALVTVAAVAIGMAVIGSSLVGLAVMIDGIGPAATLGAIERPVARVALAALVVVPGACFAQRLLASLRLQGEQLDLAIGRNRLLARVADTGNQLLSGESLPAARIIGRTLELGFASVDIVESSNGVDWVELAAVGDRPLPPPGAAGSGLRRRDGTGSMTAVHGDDPDGDERRALLDRGLSLVVANTVAKRLGRIVVLRAGLDRRSAPTPDHVELFRLLSGQVALAARNDDLTGELQTLRDRQQRIGFEDPVTGLANHAGLVEALGRALLDATARPVVLVWAPSDFEPTYDLLGHDRRDALLQIAANRIERVADANATVGRIRGQEFALVIPGAPEPDAVADVVSRLEHAGREPFDVGGELVHLSTAVGLTVAEAGTDPAELIRRAQVARREVATNGIADGTAERYRTELDRHRGRRSSLARALPGAIAAGEIGDGGLELAYQPVRRLTGRNALVGFAACVEWRDPDRGEIAPGELTEVAELSGRLAALNRFVVERAAGAAATWSQRSPGLPFFVSVRVAPPGLVTAELIDQVRLALELTGLDPAQLVLEFGPDIVTRGDGATRTGLSALAALGIGVFVDAPGDERTSRSALEGLSLSGLKLDRRWTDRVVAREDRRVQTESLIVAGKELDLLIVAQGIDGPAQLAAMSELGCGFGQGGQLGGPVDVETASRLVEEEYSGAAAPSPVPAAGRRVEPPGQ